ncbi:hypothetical protein BDBG_07065 [Blastomyces gilchristii SLH14081]|uniref:Uncharacterized protein n=1 Tax=Blastomyces gilchristii (strain SLH14081) TaxID=559298 RepID=A0A179UWX4_BLAGS|nr:uncharacterized protein BDBG_07065 [Blastomyces gilchristii SLH14081]OAT11618.1 hypothetical protein BDBG_07065 [Blastomyces gilchristii SLH14081]
MYGITARFYLSKATKHFQDRGKKDQTSQAGDCLSSYLPSPSPQYSPPDHNDETQNVQITIKISPTCAYLALKPVVVSSSTPHQRGTGTASGEKAALFCSTPPSFRPTPVYRSQILDSMISKKVGLFYLGENGDVFIFPEKISTTRRKSTTENEKKGRGAAVPAYSINKARLQHPGAPSVNLQNWLETLF